MKKFFKIFFSTLIIVALYSTWGIILTHKEESRSFFQGAIGINRPCRKPLKFSVGHIDPKFGMSSENVIILAKKAADVWNQEANKTILEYDPGAQFKINLVFDERQASTLQAKNLEENLRDLESSREALLKQYGSLSAAYEKKMDVYENDLNDYKKKLDKYNQKVDYWNEKGGAPEDVYDDIKKEQKELSDALKGLEKEREAVNGLAGKSNTLVAEENMIVKNYNNNLNTYKSQFGDPREFEKGLFSGTEINIYQFQKVSDLEMTLIHELGHYVGLDHVENPASVMYYLMGDQNLDSPALTKEDLAELKNVCKLN